MSNPIKENIIPRIDFFLDGLFNPSDPKRNPKIGIKNERKK